MNVSQLFAISQNTKCEGTCRCHWCGSPCSRNYVHDDPPPVPFVRSISTAKVPSSPYICIGCWLWRRKKVTIFFLRGEAALRDGQCAGKHSWWITPEGAWAIHPSLDAAALYEHLLNPPKLFSLSLIEDKHENLLQLGLVNLLELIKADTPLRFTFNNIPHTYTIYELETALKQKDATGLSPGVQVLTKLLGFYQIKGQEEKKEEKRERGRPLGDNNAQENKEIKASKRVIRS